MPSPSVSPDPRPLVAPLRQIPIKFSPFDQHHYQRLIRAREDAIRNVLHGLIPALGLKTALDAGSGVGFFSQTLADCGLNVRGFDGRTENVAEARKRFPHIPFEQANLEEHSVLRLGEFDLVLCFGLLYHLENPLLAVRHLRSLTEKCLLLESMCVPDDKPSMPGWSRYRFLAGANKYIQQESTFWRRSLWEKAGGELNAAYRDVGDFDLWVRFFRHARLYSVDALIGGYRFHPDAISSSNMQRYNERCDKIIESELKSIPRAAAVKVFRRVSSAVKNIPKVRGIWQRVALKSLYRLAWPDWPPVVVDQENKWVIRGAPWRTRPIRR